MVQMVMPHIIKALKNKCYLESDFSGNLNVDLVHLVVFRMWMQLGPDDGSFQGSVVMFAKRKKLYLQG